MKQSTGSNNHKRKLTSKDIYKKSLALAFKKYQYNNMSLNECRELLESGYVKGVYLVALMQVTYTKEVANLSETKPI